MYFSRITINPVGIDAKQLSRLACGDTYHEHQLLWTLFDSAPDAKRDFIFRREQIQGWPAYYVVSERLPENQQNILSVEHKIYHPKIYVGQHLAFRLRVNPVVTHTSEQGKRLRHDVVMHLKKKIDYKNLLRSERPPEIQLVQQAGFEWLQRRACASGFEFQSSAVNVDGYMQHKTYKKYKMYKKNSSICYSTLDYEGLLTVVDVDAFYKTLMRGIGPAKAFGCGLFLVRQV